MHWRSADIFVMPARQLVIDNDCAAVWPAGSDEIARCDYIDAMWRHVCCFSKFKSGAHALFRDVLSIQAIVYLSNQFRQLSVCVHLAGGPFELGDKTVDHPYFEQIGKHFWIAIEGVFGSVHGGNSIPAANHRPPWNYHVDISQIQPQSGKQRRQLFLQPGARQFRAR